jgi:hypothetical protein
MMFSTFAEQDYFRFPDTKTYTGCIINANMASHAPAGLAGFIVEKTAGVSYIIDPLTHAFQHEPSCITDSKNKVKKAIQDLATSYGEPIASTVGRRPLHPSHFKDKNIITDFTLNCINYQRDQLSSAVANNDSAKYLEDLELEKMKTPYALVAPYFYMTGSTFGEWVNVNLQLSQIAVQKKKENEKIFAEIIISQDVLRSEKRVETLLQLYAELNVDGYLLWIDEFCEHNSDREILESFYKLSSGLRASGQKEVINLHGGYFSILIAGNGGNGALSGVAHGPEFGEYRAVVPVGGGIPISRYYIPQLHNRVRYREAQRILKDMGYLENADVFHREVCSCATCQGVLSGNIAKFTEFGDATVKNITRGDGFVRREFPTTEAKEKCLQHYLRRKALEYSFAAHAPKDRLLGLILESYKNFSKTMSLEEISHLKIWYDILK